MRVAFFIGRNMKVEKSISIIGCGWLGFPLATDLIEEGFEIIGTTTNKEKLDKLSSAGIRPHLLSFTPSLATPLEESIWKSDIIILNFPPKRRNDIITYFKKQIDAFLDLYNKYSSAKVIFISSTSVYPETGETFTELSDNFTPSKKSGKALLEAEETLRKELSDKLTVLRLGGLIGKDRKPSNFLARKKGLVNPASRTNIIHQKDAIGIIKSIIHKQVFGHIFNGCSPLHPTKEEFYTQAAILASLDTPSFSTPQPNNTKIVNSVYITEKLNYSFIFDNPIDALEK